MTSLRVAGRILLAAALLASPAGASDTRLSDLIERADALALHREPGWLALLHYESSLWRPGRRSHVDTPDFFLAERGARDARAELHATLHAFFDPSARVAEQHPQCAFIARRRWLAQRLDFAAAGLPLQDCEHYERWREGIGASSLSLIFPEGFMNNPASMFGHTLLRLDLTREPSARDVLAYALDFTGDTGGEGALAYLAKGILGFYPGYFGVNPYYQQLARYADWENRDIWEYRLAFGADELDFMLMHLWELRGVAFPYYFFDENCSYQLLKLMEVGRPELELSREFPLTVIPVDTVRSVVDVPNLVESVRYRPSPATRLRHELRALGRRERRLVREIAEGKRELEDEELSSLADPQRAAVLSAAYDWLRYSYLAGQVSEESSRGLSRQILIARSRLGPGSEEAPTSEEPPTPSLRPDQGHRSSLVSLGGGWDDDRGFLELRIRPAFHGLMDPQEGYPPHMQIGFLDTRVRYQPGYDRVRLQELVLVEAISLSPRGQVFEPIAWKLDTGLRTRRVAGSGGGLREEPVWRSGLGVGLASDAWPHLLGYGLAELSLDVGPGLDDVASFGPGARVGLYTDLPGDRWRGHLFATVTRYALGDPTTFVRAVLQQRLRLGRQIALELEGSFNRIEEESWLQGSLSLGLYF